MHHTRNSRNPQLIHRRRRHDVSDLPADNGRVPLAIGNIALANDRIYGLGRKALEQICTDGCRRQCGGDTANLTRRRQGTYFVIAVQCAQCGAAMTDSLRRSDFPTWNTFPAFDEGLSERFFRERSDRTHRAWEEQSADRKAAYAAYLQTPVWRAISALVLDRDKMCQACLLRRSEVAHHLAYGPPPDFFVPLWLIKGVCRSCHDSLHARVGQDGNFHHPWGAFRWTL